MFSNPLEAFLSSRPERPSWMRPVTTAHWRGYVAVWTIARRRLYLIDIGSFLGGGKGAKGRTARLRHLFPGAGDRVFAEWYSGDLRVPRGECLEYVHLGYESHYERDLLIQVEAGSVTGARVVVHSLDDATGLAAMQIEAKRERRRHDPNWSEKLITYDLVKPDPTSE